MSRKFGSNMSYSALKNIIDDARVKHGYDLYGNKTKKVNDALDMVINHIKLNYTIKGE